MSFFLPETLSIPQRIRKQGRSGATMNTASTTTVEPTMTRTAPDLVETRDATYEAHNQNIMETPHVNQSPQLLDIDNVIYIVFDIETTGFSKDRNHIIEIACEILGGDGHRISDGQFSSLVKPPVQIPSFITHLTGITNEMVQDYQGIEVVLQDFCRFLLQKISDVEDEESIIVQKCIFVAHNGRRFDIPFLFHNFNSFNTLKNTRLEDRCYLLDTLELSKGCVKEYDLILPENFQVATMYNYVTGLDMPEDAHRAAADVSATTEILLYFRFWQNRNNYICKVDNSGKVEKINRGYVTPRLIVTPNDDSDTDSDNDQLSVSDNQNIDDEKDDAEEVLEEEFDPTPGWRRDSVFEGVDAISLFKEEFSKRVTRNSNNTEANQVLVTGIQCAVNSINTPMKSWRQIFTNSILDKMVRYTNEYGSLKHENWSNITRTDLTDFFAVLFITSIQKRKDKSTNWFSDNPLLENIIMKRIMTGRRFHLMLRFLHVCSVEKQPSRDDPEYNPSYKVKELQENLEQRFDRLFVPGPNLSLDETLIRAFGQIKFKV